MKTAFRNSFLKDLKSVRDKRLLASVKETIAIVEDASSLVDLPNLKRLKGHKNYFRIRIGEYRLGLALEDQTAVFVRLLHRRDIYRYFP